MSKSVGIFEKRRLTPNQFRAVASLRFDDATVLLDSGQNARTNGAMYLGGFVIECLLKALLLERHSNLAVPVDPAKLSSPDRDVLGLLYSHNLDDMVGFLPEVKSKLESVPDSRGALLWPAFRDVCEEWSVYAGYSSKQASMSDARRFHQTIAEVKECLRQL